MSSLRFVTSCDRTPFPKSLDCHPQQHPILYKERTFQELGKSPKTHPVWVENVDLCHPVCLTLFPSSPEDSKPQFSFPRSSQSTAGSWQLQESCVFKAKMPWNLEQKQFQPNPARYLQSQGFMFHTLLNTGSVKVKSRE